MTKEAAIQRFFNQFLQAYEEKCERVAVLNDYDAYLSKLSASLQAQEKERKEQEERVCNGKKTYDLLPFYQECIESQKRLARYQKEVKEESGLENLTLLSEKNESKCGLSVSAVSTVLSSIPSE